MESASNVPTTYRPLVEAQQEAMDNNPAGPVQGTYQPDDSWLTEATNF